MIASTPTPDAAPPRLGLPDQRLLVGSTAVFRFLLSVLLLVQAARVWSTQPELGSVLVGGVLLAVLLTSHGSFVVVFRGLRPRVASLFGHAVLDLALVTALVHSGGESSTALAALYVVVIASSSLLLPPVPGGLAVLVLACFAYAADLVVLYRGDLPSGVPGQLVVFGFVFLLVATLGRRLRETVARQSVLETELRQAKMEAGEILRSIRAGVMTIDGAGRLAFANPPAELLLELDLARDIGTPVLADLARRAPELHQAIQDGLAEGRRVARGEGFVTRSDGRTFPIGLSTATFEHEEGAVPAVTAVFTDLSELKQLQGLQLRAERLEAVAALSSSLAHEIRNPLASIRSSVEQLAQSMNADDDDRTLTRLIVRESDRLSRLLGEFLDFSRVRAVNMARVNVHDVAAEALALIREHPDAGPGITFELEGTAPPVEVDEDLLHRILSNLVLNAAQASGGHGVVSVSVAPVDGATLPQGVVMEQGVRIVVSDDGPGIPPELQDRLFQPFVSGRAGGSGLGLAIVNRAVEAHQGYVFVDSEPGRGATFTILLPSRPYRENLA